MKKVMLIFGTRPEAIKMCPLVLELKRRPEFETVVCVTGQHREMLDQILQCFQVTPQYDLAIMRDKQTLFDVTVSILEKLRAILESEKPDVVLVHGDTSTAGDDLRPALRQIPQHPGLFFPKNFLPLPLKNLRD